MCMWSAKVDTNIFVQPYITIEAYRYEKYFTKLSVKMYMYSYAVRTVV